MAQNIAREYKLDAEMKMLIQMTDYVLTKIKNNVMMKTL